MKHKKNSSEVNLGIQGTSASILSVVWFFGSFWKSFRSLYTTSNTCLCRWSVYPGPWLQFVRIATAAPVSFVRKFDSARSVKEQKFFSSRVVYGCRIRSYKFATSSKLTIWTPRAVSVQRTCNTHRSNHEMRMVSAACIAWIMLHLPLPQGRKHGGVACCCSFYLSCSRPVFVDNTRRFSFLFLTPVKVELS